MQHIKLMFCSVKTISVVLKLRRTHTPQFHFAVSKQNTNIKLRCLHHKMIISNTIQYLQHWNAAVAKEHKSMNMMILLVTILFYCYQVGSNNQKQFICQHNLNI